MGANAKIEWADHTFNPWVGCTKISPACDHCYARLGQALGARRVGPRPGSRQRTSEANWRLPLKWNVGAERTGTRPCVFCASLADVFDNEVDPKWRYDLFCLILSTPHLDWLLFTRCIGNAARMIEDALPERMKALPYRNPLAWLWANVWIGATICNQE